VKSSTRTEKDSTIGVRVTAPERRALERAAARRGEPLSGWLRRIGGDVAASVTGPAIHVNEDDDR